MTPLSLTEFGWDGQNLLLRRRNISAAFGKAFPTTKSLGLTVASLVCSLALGLGVAELGLRLVQLYEVATRLPVRRQALEGIGPRLQAVARKPAVA